MLRAPSGAVILVLLLLVPAIAQAPRFEAASVKPVAGTNNFTSLGLQPGGRVIAQNVPLRLLIRAAYGLEDYQVIGGPDWMNRQRFEVQATAGRDITAADARVMLQALLADRFALRTRTDTRELPVYHLTQASARPAAGLRPAASECLAVQLPSGMPVPPPPPSALASFAPLNPGLALECPSVFAPDFISARRVTLDLLASRLAATVQRPVINHTKLTGQFDIDLRWSNTDSPQLVTALTEQLGLRLEPARGPVPVLVIDAVQRPTDN